MRKIDWNGCFVVAVTPFAADGSLDEMAIRRLIDTFVDDGVAGIILAGSTGEWYSMSVEERAELFRIGVSQNHGRVTLLGGSSAISTREAVRVTAAAKQAGCDGTLLLPPPYVLPTERELHAFIAAVDEVGLPIMMYNNPGRTGVNLDARRMTELTKLRNVVALKDSAKDLAQLAATLRAVRSELAVFVGFESYIVSCVQRGAVGAVGMAPNVLGNAAVQHFDRAAAGETGFEALQEKIDLLYEAMYGWNYNPYVVAKEAMRLIGRPGGHPRPPLLPMLDADREKLRRYLTELGAVPLMAAQ